MPNKIAALSNGGGFDFACRALTRA